MKSATVFITSTSAGILRAVLSSADESEKRHIWQTTRVSLSPRSSACSSSPTPPPEAAAAAEDSHRNQRSASSSGSDIADFRPLPSALPPRPEDLAADIPFQFWYSYADRLLAGIKKTKSDDPGVNSGGKNGRRSRLWQAALTEEYGKDVDQPKGGSRAGRDGDGEDRSSNAGKQVVAADVWERRQRAAALGLEEVDDTPLSENEVKLLVGACHGANRQINMGWAGWNPNYVKLVHGYWKRAPVCKIKCKGVVTLDMDDVCNKLEAETGGKVIRRRGGAVYLFRGRNYWHWRDARDVAVGRQSTELQFMKKFPKRLPVPCTLTKEDVVALRARGRDLEPLCKLGKHGVYISLVEEVRRAFETQDLVRVNCQRFHARNFKALAFRLQDLVPCTLISFEFEHILIWRGKEYISPERELEV